MNFHKLEEHPPGNWPAAEVSLLSKLLRNAQKFYVGHVSRIPQKPIAANAFPRLPFSTCAFEFLMDWGDDELSLPINVICLARNAKAMADDPRVLPDDIGLTFFCAIGRVMRREVWAGCGQAYFREGVLSVRGSKSPPVALTDELRPQPVILREGVGELAEPTVFWLASFLRVLNCVNVKTETIDAPERLNKKRTKNGKPPVYSYKVLVLRPSAAQRADLGGTHQSPRVHLRRGHIKHRATGDFWWGEHAVGDRRRGIVAKDYRADELLPETAAAAHDRHP